MFKDCQLDVSASLNILLILIILILIIYPAEAEEWFRSDRVIYLKALIKQVSIQPKPKNGLEDDKRKNERN